MISRLLCLFVCALGLAAQAQTTLQSQLEQSLNPHIRGYANVLAGSIWLTRTLYVCWENPESASPADLEHVKAAVEATWQSSSSLTFSGWQKCAPVNKGIRIRIDDSGPHTQALGNKIDGMRDGMVLNFTFANWSPDCQTQRDFCIRSIAVHEFGHALGFAHEQNRFDAPGECRALAQGGNGDLMLTPYDPESVMNYCNPSYNNNGLLSKLDIAALQTLYGQAIERAVVRR